MEGDELVQWLRKIDVYEEGVELAMAMGLQRVYDFKDFEEKELVGEWGFTAVDARKIKQALNKFQIDVNETDSGLPCVAIYPYAAVKETHLNASAGEKFTAVNTMFDWWLCINEDGEKGLLPSNHIKIIEDGDDKSVNAYELPSFAVRKHVDLLTQRAVADQTTHSLTYIRVKQEIVEKFGEEMFNAEKEHVKEMIRRTEAKLRLKHESVTAQAADRAIKKAKKRKIKITFASRATNIQKRKSTHGTFFENRVARDDQDGNRDSMGDAIDQALEILEALDTLPAPETEASSIHRAHSHTSEDMSERPPMPPPRPSLGAGMAVDLAANRAAVSHQASSEAAGKTWMGGWFLKKSPQRNVFGFALSSAYTRHWCMPSDAAGLEYFANKETAVLEGHISISSRTVVAFPRKRKNTILIQSGDLALVHELVAEKAESFEGLRRYISERRKARGTAPLINVGPSGIVGADDDEAILGAGTFGTAKLVQLMGTDVVMKCLQKVHTMNAAILTQFQDAVGDLPTLRHINVAHVLGIGVHEDQPFRVEHFGERRSLYFMLYGRAASQESVENTAISTSLSWFKRLNFIKDIACGMNFLHKHFEYPHLGLHTDNIIVTAGLRAQISDFGVYRLEKSLIEVPIKSAGTELSRKPTVIGKWPDFCAKLIQRRRKQGVYYMGSLAPEIWAASSNAEFAGFQETDITLATDVYSFAVVCFEIIGGVLPWVELDDMAAVETAMRTAKLPSIPEGTPDDITALILRCWKSNPSNRPFFPQLIELLGIHT